MFQKFLVTAALVLLVTPFTFVAGSPEGRGERAELRFLEGMMDHHQMALDMANDCLAKASTPEVVTLCQVIIDAQTAEIEQMRQWLSAWYGVDYAPVSMLPSDGMDMGHESHGEATPAADPTMMMGMMAGLNALEGVDYEVAWLESMIDHHDDAIHMAERILPRAVHDELSQLASAIISDQSAEIETMEALIVTLSGTSE